VVWAAQDCGAPHKRERLFFLAYREGEERTRDMQSRGGLAGFADEGGGLAVSEQLGDGRRAVYAEGRREAPGVEAFQTEGPGTQLADTEGEPCGQGRPEHEGQGVSAATEQSGGEMADANRERFKERPQPEKRRGIVWQKGSATGENSTGLFPPAPNDYESWDNVCKQDPSLEPAVCGVADGMAYRVHRLRMLGNGVVPVQAAVAFCALVDIARTGQEDGGCGL
jgi:DNA (cytosine-5)-methyltransferase 1